MSAARCADLHESKLALIFWVLLQKPLDCVKAFWYPLRIVHPINANSDKSRVDSQAMHQRCAFNVLVSEAHAFNGGLSGNVDTDRERMDDGSVTLARHGKMLPIHACFQGTVDSLQEIVAVRLGVKPHKVGPE